MRQQRSKSETFSSSRNRLAKITFLLVRERGGEKGARLRAQFATADGGSFWIFGILIDGEASVDDFIELGA